jgi:hypothetical protein
LLAGRSSAPAADDVEPLLKRQLRKSLENNQSAMCSLGGESGGEFMRAKGVLDPARIRVENVEILESGQLTHDHYEPRLRAEIVAGDEQRKIETATVCVNEASSGWQLLPD